MKRGKKTICCSVFTDRAAEKIAGVIAGVQRGFAVVLNRLTRNYSPATWRILIIFFATAWGMASIWCIASAVGEPAAVFNKNALQSLPRSVQSDSLVLLEQIYKQHKKNGDE